MFKRIKNKKEGNNLNKYINYQYTIPSKNKFKEGLDKLENVAKIIYTKLGKVRKRVISPGAMVIYGLEKFAKRIFFGLDGGNTMVDTKITCECENEIDLTEFGKHIETECEFMLNLDSKIKKYKSIDNKAKDNITRLLERKDNLLFKAEQKTNIIDMISYIDNNGIIKAIKRAKRYDELTDKVISAKGFKKILLKAKRRLVMSAGFIFAATWKVLTTLSAVYIYLNGIPGL